MERGEAEAIYEQGRDVVVAVLRRMDEQIETLTAKVVAQDERIAKLEPSLPSSTETLQITKLLSLRARTESCGDVGERAERG